MKLKNLLFLSSFFISFFILSSPAARAQSPVHVYDAGEKTYHGKKFRKGKRNGFL